MTVDPDEFNRSEAIYDELALVIGRANIAWNDVHTAIFGLFREMSGMPWAAADAVFFSLRNDSAQRDITAALAKVTLSKKPDERDKLLAILNGVGKKAAERNAAIHTAWFVRAGEEEPSVFLRRTAPKALKPKVRQQFRALTLSLGETYLELCQLERELFP